jgi:hypothetical protein
MSSEASPGAAASEIGGYFGLELGRRGDNPHAAARALNSATNCLLYFLLARRPARVHLPAYICGSMIEPLLQVDVEHRFYGIDADLEIAAPPALGDDELLLYVNYFGLKNSHCRSLAARYGPALIVDNAQALFCPPPACAASLYSPRKFFGVSDGGYLHTEAALDVALERDVSYDAFRHLAGRIDVGAAEFYQDFRRAEQRLRGRPLRRMSALTEGILGSVDYVRAKQQRERNFLFLHAALGHSNLLRIDVAEVDGPMVYPYLSDDATLRQRLLARRIYVATYWDDVLQRDSASALEKRLAARLVPLPIDQRYGPAEMQVIVETVRGKSWPGEP